MLCQFFYFLSCKTQSKNRFSSWTSKNNCYICLSSQVFCTNKHSFFKLVHFELANRIGPSPLSLFAS